ncbi:hypothetical protein NT2_05_02990 [Caenibius tardaugens NBRC 16725]|uniref:Uncharacterized protein n=1 Tax=Caenibius tardaugens NBRC 16725 TaxID=1219035 RepID=U3A3Q7_9SPHN|nr:hypothetical protein [Caenibius tardaugens]AZI36716.1 hypothetical protein EGO55_12740 [Caenibius tardaugens NBRC 16725]GAD49378.1 hypothetical protein NT2_05_02990 [Caenibius tardaugens NBRC 16725]
MTRSRTSGPALWHVVSFLLLLLVAFHAAMPLSAPLERTSGSAFSSSTMDVSVLRARPADTARRTAGLTPALPALFVATAAVPHLLSAAIAAPRLRTIAQTGPPNWTIAPSSRAARAPPAA